MSGLTKYLSLYHRLIALSQQEPDNPNSCWVWKGPLKGRQSNYPKINVWAGGKTRTLSAHRVALVVAELDGDWSVFWDLYHLYSVAMFEADHECNNPCCINPDHLFWRTQEDHRRVTLERRRARPLG